MCHFPPQSLNRALVDLNLLPPPPGEDSGDAKDTECECLTEKPLESMSDVWKSLQNEGQQIDGNSGKSCRTQRSIRSHELMSFSVSCQGAREVYLLTRRSTQCFTGEGER